MEKLLSPIDPSRYVGTVIRSNASTVMANLPHATARPESRGLAKGAVGDFVFVDCARYKILGRIVETHLPDAERLHVEPKYGAVADPDPIGQVQLLASLEQTSSRLVRGITEFPRIGDGIYAADPALLARIIGNATGESHGVTLDLGIINAGSDVCVQIAPEKVFGRHCGVFGTTGGGKSWTLATLIEQLRRAGGKAILLDPTGEFSKLPSIDKVMTFGRPSAGQVQVHFPYRSMTEDDLFTLFRPSGQSQGPRLRQAIKSLKLVAALGGAGFAGVNIQANGSILKSNEPRQALQDAFTAHSSAVHSVDSQFDVLCLAEQVQNECVWASGRDHRAHCFGGADQGALSYCEPLIARINTLVNSPELQCLFGTAGSSLVTELDTFLEDATQSVACISFKDIRFEHNTREILLNVVGRNLLMRARNGDFLDAPLVAFLDEAHQFLGRIIGDEYASVRLDAFGLIAKEGRKYGLTCVLATQRPRDVPQDVLSQLGTMIVHRLINDQDRQTVERACGDLDRGAAQFIPILGPGEAIILGPDLPAPLPMKILAPTETPDSTGPDYQRNWSRAPAPQGND